MGCGQKEKDTQSISTEEIPSDNSEVVEQSVEQPEEQPDLFTFVDAKGEAHETEIKAGVPQTVYSDDCFWTENGQTGYEDDTYTSRQGIDVSHHQGEIDWEKVKAAGIDFAILRIGYRGYGQEGTLNLDQEFNRNIENAQAAGIDVGVYFFAQAINEDEAREEADFVLQNLEGYELQLPVVYDPESILDDDARTDDVSGEQFTKNTIAFCEKIKEAGYTPMIYSNMLWEAFEFDMEQLTMYPFWYADYEALPQTPYTYEMWQYSESGQVDGIDEAVDLDVQFLKK
jgi:GH25 family lysozyme M1 (1,4-beta-N-acetylmuramidase)